MNRAIIRDWRRWLKRSVSLFLGLLLAVLLSFHGGTSWAQSPAELFAQGRQQYDEHNYEAAIATWQQTLDLYHRPEDQAATLNALAAAHLALGQNRAAVAWTSRALDTAQQIDEPALAARLQAQALGNQGIAQRGVGQYLDAIATYQQALTLMQSQDDQLGESRVLGLLGNAYESLGDFDQAVEFHRRSLAIAKSLNNPMQESAALNNLGATQATEGNYADAIELYQQSLAIAKTLNDDLRIGYALNNLGTAYHAQKQLNQAIEHYNQSLTLAETVGNTGLEIDALSGLGLAYEDRDDYERAIALHARSVELSTKIDDPRRQGRALNNLGHARFGTGQLDQAEAVLRDAIDTLEQLRPTQDQYNISLFDTHVLTYNLLQQILVAQDNPEAALEIAERGRAQAFVELLAQRSTKIPNTKISFADIQAIARDQQATLVEYTLVPDASFKVQGKQRGTAESLYIWVVQPSGEVTFRQVDLKENNVSIAELVKTSRELTSQRWRYRSGIRGSSQQNTRLRSAIRPGDRVRREGEPLDWAPYEVTAIDPRAGTVTLSHPDFVLPNPVVPLSDVYKITPSAFAPVLQKRQHWRELHQLLIAPIADLLPSDASTRIVFIPQEQLFLVPFPALQAEDDSYLIEHHTIVTAPAIQVLQQTHQPAATPFSQTDAMLIVGDPSPMPDNLQPLPHARTEAKSIAELLNTKALIGHQATEPDIKQALSSARLIHLATHGFFNETNPLEGSLALAPAAGDIPGTVGDGFLTAAEILESQLNADLVVLSACDTGRGRITGDGVVGLSRSFLAAGAPSVMVSLWQVPDEATSALMLSFYQQLLAGKDKAQALRQAMLSMLDAYPAPLNWAAFTLVGG
ncbi:CHAT domain-containing protein [Leptolyngbya cf. ectocarpi LEGE 11479]|uniref:CHAT domain-containing protein n=1 Tax=Leptolyngbya cf. ectocarpi LEGE 11479 TaxID=1828722 RepID=A0A928ZVV8_LEPEC|nr:CHAT domain-containing tetratricopeptide repeat protein [Leptolyngbya ectocarpi]MBE9068434.1 CHAT domain-containing protein [Leptolyngbya cf. ectocarpi LEGE 11479]